MRDRLQHVVTGEVAVGIVYPLEMVDIEHDEREIPAVALGPPHLAFQGLEKVALVVDLGESVDSGEPVDLFVVGAFDVVAGQKLEDATTDFDEVAVAQDVVLVLDNSGSMRKNDPNFLVKDGVRGFVENLDPSIRIAVLIFDQDVNWVVPFTEASDANKPEILASLDGINYDGLYTDSRAAMEAQTKEEIQDTGAHAS